MKSKFQKSNIYMMSSVSPWAMPQVVMGWGWGNGVGLILIFQIKTFRLDNRLELLSSMVLTPVNLLFFFFLLLAVIYRIFKRRMLGK